MPAVRFFDVSKRFGERLALDRLGFEIPRGCVTGLLGPNGSGKTTTLRLLLNLYYPDQGTIRVLGGPPNTRLNDRIGYLPEERGLYRSMRVLELLRYYSLLKSQRATDATLNRWLERLELGQYRNLRIEQLSKGTAQKIQFIAAVLHRPELLILDEPFSGLDPISRHTLTHAMSELVKQGTTLLLSTHDTHLAENICQRFLMLDRGRKVLDGNHQEIRHRFGQRSVKLKLVPPLRSDLELLGVEQIVQHTDHQELVLAAKANPQQVLETLTQLGDVQHFEVAQPSLNDIFLRLAGSAAQGRSAL